MNDYPTEEQLDLIRTFPVNEIADCYELLSMAIVLWHWHDMVTIRWGVWTFITGGWSGNEDIISALKANTMFWMMMWQSSDRGGKHVFCKAGALLP